jgi:hypothetical protein
MQGHHVIHVMLPRSSLVPFVALLVAKLGPDLVCAPGPSRESPRTLTHILVIWGVGLVRVQGPPREPKGRRLKSVLEPKGRRLKSVLI